MRLRLSASRNFRLKGLQAVMQAALDTPNRR